MILGAHKLEGSRNFTNKLWNASRFVIGNINGGSVGLPDTLALAEDRWILSRLNRVTEEVTDLLEEFQLGEALRRVYEFLWTEYCDWYIEIAKIRLRKDGASSPLPVLVHVLETSLRLLHPFLPFITEEIWQMLREHQPEGKADSIMVSPYPSPDRALFDDEAEREMDSIIEIVRSIRNARVEGGVGPARFIEAVIAAGDSRARIESHAPAIAALARVRPLRVLDRQESAGARRDQAKVLVLRDVEVILPLEGMIDFEAERSRLATDIEAGEAEIARTERLLSDSSFLEKAPAAIVEKERRKLEDRRDKVGRLKERLARLS
jgi:valyl-tRNA synthetase